MTWRRTHWFALITCVTIGFAALGLRQWQAAERVEVVYPRRGAAVEIVYATGTVEPIQLASVAARMTAPVRAVLVDEGDRVRSGQPLVTLDDDDARSELAQARARSVGATLGQRRIEALFKQGWTTGASRDEAVANGMAARAAERLAAARLRQTVVRAGFDGVVLKRDIEPGELAVPTRTLMLLGDPRRSWITATVDERDIPHVRVGQRAWLATEAWPGRSLAAHVVELTPGGNPELRAFRVRLRLDQDERLPTGLSFEVNIVTRSVANTLLLPVTAVTDRQIWTVIDGHARRRRVTTGIAGLSAIEVHGIDTRTPVIAAPTDGLREGSRIAVSGR